MPRPGSRIEKSKDFKGSMKKLIKSLKNWYAPILFALCLAFFSAIMALIAPNKLSDLADYITEGLRPHISENVIQEIMTSDEISTEDKMKMQEIMSGLDANSKTEELLEAMDQLPEDIYDVIKPTMDMAKIKKVSLFLAILYIISSLFAYIEQITMALVTNKYSKDLRKKITDKINKLPLKYFDNHEAGDILSRVTNDVDSISMNLNRSLADLITSITLFIGSIIMMFYTNWIMAITGIVASLIGFAFMGLILSKSQKYFVERQERLGDLNGYIEEIYSGHNVVYSYNGEVETNKNFDKLNHDLFKCSRMSQFLSGIMPPFMGFVGNLGYVAVCVVGALLTMNDVISFGVIVAFMIYVRMFTNPLNQIAQAATSMQSVAAAAERVFAFTAEEEEPDEKHLTKKLDLNDIKGNIEFHNVKFSYDKERPIIKNFSANIKEGQKVAIVGPTGAGKTTMVNLLMKFYDIDEGEIIIDGISTKDLTRENIHDLFVMVLQDTWLFDGTIGENIKYNSDATEEEIWKATKIVGIDHFIKTLPGGLKSKVGDQENISSGEKQLLTIARGMIKEAPFLILDEATSNVDTRTEELVQKAMDKLIKGKTSFIIAHRLSTIKNADLILVMNEGNIIEQGTHEELMKKNGFYSDLYNSQFEL
jgi:ATP-binding cassette subfamily B protein